jgi:hypothetical protein
MKVSRTGGDDIVTIRHIVSAEEIRSCPECQASNMLPDWTTCPFCATMLMTIEFQEDNA